MLFLSAAVLFRSLSLTLSVSLAKFTGKHLCQSLFFNNVTGQGLNFTKKETSTQVFSCEFGEISKNTF